MDEKPWQGFPREDFVYLDSGLKYFLGITNQRQFRVNSFIMSQQPAKKGESSGNATGNINASAKPAKGQGKGNKSKGPTSDSKEPEKKEESQKTGPKKSTYIRCALLFGDAGPILASHEKFGVDTSCG
ncbi:hypothetical protein FPSE5266_10255 [Fusarium pseudograminearum]|nr:hypothetical protein FPSE5266_10255 [Fusarium pseudograminearum]